VGSSKAGVFRTETEYLVACRGGVEQFSEVHVLGLFELDDYADALTAAGLEYEFVAENRGLFIHQAGSPLAASHPPV
jgi:hypothetical protein